MALPPTRTEVAGTARPDHNGTQVAVGADLGSALPTTMSRVEVGGGLIYRTREESGDMNWQKGGYLDVGYAVLNSKFARVIVGARGERYGKDGVLKVAKLRVDAELLAAVSGSEASAGGCGAGFGGVAGNVGLGVFAEAGRSFVTTDAMVDPHAVGWVASAGITVRVPAMFGVAIGLGKSSGCSGGGDSSGSSGSSGSHPHISGE